MREKCFQNQHCSSFPTPCRNLPTDHFKNKPLLCKHSDKVAFLIVEKIYFRLNSHSSKHNILFICVENKSVNTFARSLDYHKTDRKKLINYTPQHHMLLYNIDYHCIWGHEIRCSSLLHKIQTCFSPSVWVRYELQRKRAREHFKGSKIDVYTLREIFIC